MAPPVMRPLASAHSGHTTPLRCSQGGWSGDRMFHNHLMSVFFFKRTSS